jgi:hypothetical protein
MKLCSFKYNGTNIGDTEEETLVSFGELMRLTSVNSNLSTRFSFAEYGNSENRRYSLFQGRLGILNSLVIGGIGNKYHFTIKDIRKTLVDVKRAFLQIEVTQTICSHSNQIFLLRIER